MLCMSMYHTTVSYEIMVNLPIPDFLKCRLYDHPDKRAWSQTCMVSNMPIIKLPLISGHLKMDRFFSLISICRIVQNLVDNAYACLLLS